MQQLPGTLPNRTSNAAGLTSLQETLGKLQEDRSRLAESKDAGKPPFLSFSKARFRLPPPERIKGDMELRVQTHAARHQVAAFGSEDSRTAAVVEGIYEERLGVSVGRPQWRPNARSSSSRPQSASRISPIAENLCDDSIDWRAEWRAIPQIPCSRPSSASSCRRPVSGNSARRGLLDLFPSANVFERADAASHAQTPRQVFEFDTKMTQDVGDRGDGTDAVSRNRIVDAMQAAVEEVERSVISRPSSAGHARRASRPWSAGSSTSCGSTSGQLRRLNRPQSAGSNSSNGQYDTLSITGALRGFMNADASDAVSTTLPSHLSNSRHPSNSSSVEIHEPVLDWTFGGSARNALSRTSHAAYASLAPDTDVSELLDMVQRGWATKFASVFQKLGFELVSNLAEASPSELSELQCELAAVGARAFHLRKIWEAIASLREFSQNTTDEIAALQMHDEETVSQPDHSPASDMPEEFRAPPQCSLMNADDELRCSSTQPATEDCIRPADNAHGVHSCEDFAVPLEWRHLPSQTAMTSEPELHDVDVSAHLARNTYQTRELSSAQETAKGQDSPSQFGCMSAAHEKLPPAIDSPAPRFDQVQQSARHREAADTEMGELAEVVQELADLVGRGRPSEPDQQHVQEGIEEPAEQASRAQVDLLPIGTFSLLDHLEMLRQTPATQTNPVLLPVRPAYAPIVDKTHALVKEQLNRTAQELGSFVNAGKAGFAIEAVEEELRTAVQGHPRLSLRSEWQGITPRLAIVQGG